ncbi:MAG: type I polyketide synthase, partial [Xanthomonadaceae bacterium]|nr:type I polyketide synthase [Xanthomonadaceae bacterium]
MKPIYDSDGDIAIVGMAGLYPGARTIEKFWEHLSQGEDAAIEFSDEALRAAGVTDAELDRDQYVKRGLVLDGAEDFDAAFFRFTPREAQVMNPELRLLLETSHHALEDAAIDPEHDKARVGCFIGIMGTSYLQRHIIHNPALIEQVGAKNIQLGNDASFSATHVAYRLNLRGPAMGLATACSTSLVATHLARQSLLNYDCDVALVGGSHLAVNHGRGYLYQEGGIHARDGYCRPFDHRASGTISGSGVGVIVLKRLCDAQDDGNSIVAVIKSTAINNDGADKVGFTAPGLNGQAAVINEALALADIRADAIGYHECHGTGTALGDPIEIAALTQAHRHSSERIGYCALGALKANFGHMAATAGVAGLSKAALALQRQSIPPLIHFEQANPELRLSTTPFVVPTERRAWPRAEQPRYASVSAFGMGGTNAHAILCEAPAQVEAPTRRQWHLLPFSANDAQALKGQRDALKRWGQDRSASTLADAAQTLTQGRRRLGWRDYWVVGPEGQWHGGPAATVAEDLRMVWMFPGQGSQYPGMGRDLYAREPAYRQAMDECLALLEDSIDQDLRHLLLSADAEDPAEQECLRETDIAQCALFCASYAMARLWLAYGLRPTGMIGHSIGEYVAAAVAEVASLSVVLGWVRQRAGLMRNAPAGAMLSINASLTQVENIIADVDTWDVAAINTPDSCVLSGDIDTIETLEERLQKAGVATKRVFASRAFHSRLMSGAASAFKPDVAEVRAPQIAYVSNLDGQPVTEARLREPTYWVDHLRQTVRFADGVRTLAAQGPTVFLEVGPGQALTRTLGADRALDATAVIPSMRHIYSCEPDEAVLLQAIGRLWTHGIELAAERRYEGEARRLISLPPYPFTRRRHALEPAETSTSRPVQDTV